MADVRLLNTFAQAISKHHGQTASQQTSPVKYRHNNLLLVKLISDSIARLLCGHAASVVSVYLDLSKNK